MLQVGKSDFLVVFLPLLVSVALKGQSEAEPKAVDEDEERGEEDEGHGLPLACSHFDGAAAGGLAVHLCAQVEVHGGGARAHVDRKNRQGSQHQKASQVTSQASLLALERTLPKPLRVGLGLLDHLKLETADFTGGVVGGGEPFFQALLMDCPTGAGALASPGHGWLLGRRVVTADPAGGQAAAGTARLRPEG